MVTGTGESRGRYPILILERGGGVHPIKINVKYSKGFHFYACNVVPLFMKIVGASKRGVGGRVLHLVEKN